MNLGERVRNIHDRDSLVRLIREISDQISTHGEECSNSNLPSFLEAMASWIEDMDGYYASRGEESPQKLTWRNLGEIIVAALVYE